MISYSFLVSDELVHPPPASCCRATTQKQIGVPCASPNVTSQCFRKEPHMSNTSIALPDESIEDTILLIRGKRVILDQDLARLYGVSTKVLNQAVKRNLDRFPEDFMFQLTKAETDEWQRLRSQIVTLKKGRGTHMKYQPYAFTEHGILMLSSVLKSQRAVQVNIQIMRTFVRLREMLASNETLIARLDKLEENYDAKFKLVFSAIRQLRSKS